MSTDSVEELMDKLHSIITKGEKQNLKYFLKQAAGVMPLHDLLTRTFDDKIVVKRPSSGREISIFKATPLLLAISGWYQDITEMLAVTKVALNQTFSVDDASCPLRTYDQVSALMIATITGREPFVKILIENGAEINQTNSLGDTVLYEACFEGHLKIADHLIFKGAQVDRPNVSGITPLMIACFTDNCQIVDLLLKYGAKLDRTDNTGKNAMFYTIPSTSIASANLLLRDGISLTPSEHGTTLIMEAAFQANLFYIDYLLARLEPAQYDISAQDKSLRNCLFYAAEGGSVQVFSKLHQFGAKTVTLEDGLTVIMAATLKNRQDMVRFLVDNQDEFGLDVRSKDIKGRNVLFYCVSNPTTELFEFFLRAGVAVEPASNGSTILMMATAKKNLSLVEYLISRLEIFSEIDINAQNEDGWNLLFYSVSNNNLDLMRKCLSLGARVHNSQCGTEGRNLLMHACQVGSGPIAIYLSDPFNHFGFNMEEKDREGCNLLFHCIRGGNVELTRYFMDKVSLDVDNKGANILLSACRQGKIDMVQFLMHHMTEEHLYLKDKNGRNALFYCAESGSVRLFELLHQSKIPVEADGDGRSILMHAASCGKIQLVNYLLDHANQFQLNVIDTDSKGQNLLFYAIQSGSLELFKDIFFSHSSPNLVIDGNGCSPLMYAVETGSIDIADYLLDSYKDQELALLVNHSDLDGENVLFYAIRSKKIEILKRLLQQGIEPKNNKKGQSILALCFSMGQGRMADLILETIPENADLLNGCDEKGYTAFHYFVIEENNANLQKFAPLYNPILDVDDRKENVLIKVSRQGNPKLTQFILKTYPCDVGQIDSDGMNALSHSALSGNLKNCKILLSYGAQQVVANDGSTLLHFSARSNNSKVFKHFIRFIVKGEELLNKQDKDGLSAAHILCELGLWDCAELFHGLGGRFIDIRDNRNRTPLMMACFSNNLVLVKMMITHCSSNLLDYDSNNRNCLHYSCASPSVNPFVLKHLLDHKIDVLAKDGQGNTPLHLAVQYKSVKAVRLLLERGSDPYIQNSSGLNAYEICRKDNHVIQILMEQQLGLSQAQKEIIKEAETAMASVDLDALAEAMAERSIILCGHNARMLALMSRQDEKLEYFITLVVKRGKNQLHEFLKELKVFDKITAMELQAKFYGRPASEFMV